ncbi:MAG: InlB B-repeat-containing protein [Bacilli bacterium]|jgi:hypothetical protein|nr:InlB B-repeat-containing protein [Bacilli bacterium]
MKKTKLIIIILMGIFIFSPYHLRADNYDNLKEIFNKSYGSENDEELEDVIETKDGNFLAVGMTSGEFEPGLTNQHNKGYVIKVDQQGNKIWEKQYIFTPLSDPNNTTFFTSVATAADDGFIIAGHYCDNSYTANSDSVVLKIDKDGNLLWQKYFNSNDNGSADDILYDISITNDGNYLLAGRTTGTLDGNVNLGASDGWILKIDKDGNEIFSKQYGTKNSDTLRAIKEDSFGNYVAVGQSPMDSKGITSDGWILKIDKDGNEIFSQSIGTTKNERFNDLLIDDDSVVIVGYTSAQLPGETYYGDQDVWVLKLDNDNNIIFSKQYGGSGFEYGESITKINDSDYAIVGITDSNDFNEETVTLPVGFLLIVDNDGEPIKVNTYGNASDAHHDIFKSVITTKYNDLVMVGIYERTVDDNDKGNAWLFSVGFRYQLTLNSNEGKSDIDKISTKYHEELTLPNSTFTREGYQLIGWATSLENANNLVVEYQTAYLQSDKEDHVLYAVWQKVDSNDDNNNDNNNDNNDDKTNDNSKEENKKENDQKGEENKKLPNGGIDNCLLLFSMLGLSINIYYYCKFN